MSPLGSKRRRGFGPSSHHERRRRRRRRRRSRRLARRLGLAALVVVAVGAVGAALAWRDATQVRTALAGAQGLLQDAGANPEALRSAEGRGQVLEQLAQARGRIQQARNRAEGSLALSTLGAIPGLSRQHDGLLQIIDDAEVAAQVGTDLVETLDGLAGNNRMRQGQVPIDGLRALGQASRDAGGELAGLERGDSGLLGPLGQARRRLDDLARSTGQRLLDGGRAIDASLGFMGADGPRTYLMALHNNAEMRNQGTVLSYAVVRFDQGRISFGERSGSVGELRLDEPVDTPLPEGTEEVFGFINPNFLWQSVNATADYALSGQLMVDMYRQATGEEVQGVIGVDVPALARLLAVTGPVAVDGLATPISAENVAPVVLDQLYRDLGPGDSQAERRESLDEVVQAVTAALTESELDAVALGRRLGEAAAGGHLRLFSTVAEEEAVFEQTGLGGSPAAIDPERTFHLAVENRNATKVDYFLFPEAQVEVNLTPAGTAVVRTTVKMVNTVPTGAPPSYQLGPDTVNQGQPGDYLAWVLLWGPRGAVQAGSVTESGLELSQYVVLVPPSEDRTVIFETSIPDAVVDGELRLRFVPQPRLEPMPLTVTLAAPGRKVSDPLRWSGPWDHSVVLEWRIE